MDNSAFPGIVVVKVVKMAMPGTRSSPPHEGERVSMREAKDEFDLPFEILEPVEWRGDRRDKMVKNRVVSVM